MIKAIPELNNLLPALYNRLPSEVNVAVEMPPLIFRLDIR